MCNDEPQDTAVFDGVVLITLDCHVPPSLIIFCTVKVSIGVCMRVHVWVYKDVCVYTTAIVSNSMVHVTIAKRSDFWVV